MSEEVDHNFGYTKFSTFQASRLSGIFAELKEEFPDLKIEQKTKHWFWRFVAKLVCVVTLGKNRRFLDGATTTIGCTIALTDHSYERLIDHTKRTTQWENRFWATMCHEREHLRQFKKYTLIGMALLYIFCPFPVGLAWFRTKFELAGYLQTMRCYYEIDPGILDSDYYRNRWVERFTGSYYAWMWLFKKQVEGWYDQELKRLKLGA